MKINYSTQRVTVPTVYVTKGRQRVKQYDNTIYLKNGDEFEIELFNPLQSKVLAKIELNGKYLGAGIVLRPGERMFLERYIEESRKFMFQTYEVDGGDTNVQEAIKLNGVLEVKFYKETAPSQPYYRSSTITYTTNPSWTVTPTYTHYNTTIGYSGVKSSKGDIENPGVVFGNATTLSCSVDNTKSYVDSMPIGGEGLGFAGCADFSRDFAPQEQTIETGRVEKGSKSDQEFSTDNTQFDVYYSWRSVWKILPESQKPLMSEDLKVFCTNCGAKRKKSSHKFCPNCGNQF